MRDKDRRQQVAMGHQTQNCPAITRPERRSHYADHQNVAPPPRPYFTHPRQQTKNTTQAIRGDSEDTGRAQIEHAHTFCILSSSACFSSVSCSCRMRSVKVTGTSMRMSAYRPAHATHPPTHTPDKDREKITDSFHATCTAVKESVPGTPTARSDVLACQAEAPPLTDNAQLSLQAA